MNKIDFFFELLGAVYGQSKIQAQWPTDKDMQLARALYADKINSLEPAEIKAAIDNARVQKAAELDGWGWPDVDLILAGCKRYANASHREFLPAPERQVLPANERSARARALMEELA